MFDDLQALFELKRKESPESSHYAITVSKMPKKCSQIPKEYLASNSSYTQNEYIAMIDNILLIINPNASKGKGKYKAKKIKDIFSRHGRNCTIAYTSGKGHAEKLAKSGVESGFRTIIAAGGDGTVNEVINGMMRASGREKAKMGIIPVGRGNDFAWVAGIPNDIEKAVDIILNGEAKATDVGFAKGSGKEKGRYFLNGMGFGFEPMVNFKAQEYKHLNGMMSYVAAFIHILFNPPKGYNLHVKIDDDEFDLTTQQFSANNGRRMGSSFLMTPKAEIDDGLLDYMFTKKLYKGFGLIRMAFKFFRGAMVTDKVNFGYGKAHKIELSSERNLVVAHVDGEEFTRAGKHFEIEIRESAVKLYR